MLRALKTEEGAMSQEVEAASTNWKRQGDGSSRQAPRSTALQTYLRLPTSRIMPWCCFIPLCQCWLVTAARETNTTLCYCSAYLYISDPLSSLSLPLLNRHALYFTYGPWLEPSLVKRMALFSMHVYRYVNWNVLELLYITQRSASASTHAAVHLVHHPNHCTVFHGVCPPWFTHLLPWRDNQVPTHHNQKWCCRRPPQEALLDWCGFRWGI